MSEDKDFDNGIREQLEGKRFGFDEANWEKMQMIIREDEQKGKKRRFFFILSLVFTAITAFAGFWLVFENNSSGTITTQPHLVENAVVQGKEENKSGSAAPVVESGVIKDEESLQNKNVVSETNKEAAVENAALQQNASNEKETDSAGKIENASSPPSAEKRTKPSIKDKSIPKEKSSSKLRTESGSKKVKQDLAVKIAPKEEANRVNETSENQSGITGSKDDKERQDKNNSDSVVAVNAEKQTEAVAKAAVDAEKAVSDSLTKPVSSDSTAISPAAVEPAQSKPSAPVQSPLYISAEAGFYFMPGFQAGKSGAGRSLNPSGGISAQKIFPNGICVSASLYYSSIGNVSDSARLMNETVYNFGYATRYTEITVKKIHYLELPLLAGYYRNRNIFLAGASFSYNITSTSKVHSYSESYGLREEETTKKEFGYMSGFSQWDLAGYGMYRREFTERLGAALYFRVGLKDILNDDYFQKKELERNMGAGLMISFRLYK